MINNKSQGKKTHSYRPNFRVSVIIVNDKEEILLVQHKKGQRYYWVLPGGRIEYGENFASCAVRELKEETNLDIRFGKPIHELAKVTLYPPVADQIIEAYQNGFKEMKYLGNLWV
ncbi:MAG: NUDIX hydrolase [Candidatus Melainabacteria bacterium]|nr:NUDIX hydrolase [Candidatus Melainabacteria bacterium]